MAEYRGVLFLHSETGTEGGYWALQDRDFIGVPDEDNFLCTKCGKAWDRKERPGAVLHVERVVPLTYYLTENGEMDLTKPDPQDCPADDHDWQLAHPDGGWSYDGQHLLKDGNYLTIYSKEDPEQVVWEGEIRLRKHPLFTETANGWWIHSDQIGIAREDWARYFFEEHPARLVTKP